MSYTIVRQEWIGGLMISELSDGRKVISIPDSVCTIWFESAETWDSVVARSVFYRPAWINEIEDLHPDTISLPTNVDDSAPKDLIDYVPAPWPSDVDDVAAETAEIDEFNASLDRFDAILDAATIRLAEARQRLDAMEIELNTETAETETETAETSAALITKPRVMLIVYLACYVIGLVGAIRKGRSLHAALIGVSFGIELPKIIQYWNE